MESILIEANGRGDYYKNICGANPTISLWYGTYIYIYIYIDETKKNVSKRERSIKINGSILLLRAECMFLAVMSAKTEKIYSTTTITEIPRG